MGGFRGASCRLNWGRWIEGIGLRAKDLGSRRMVMATQGYHLRTGRGREPEGGAH